MLPEINCPTVITALREHGEDRDLLLASLTVALQKDPRVRAAWLWGSFGRGEEDDLSDLDPWIIVADEFVGEMGGGLKHYAEQTGNFITGGEAPHNGPPGGGFFSSLHAGRHGLLHLDCYWQPQSAVSTIPERAVLFDRLSEPMTPPTSPPLPPETSALTEDQERIEDGIGFAWLMFSIAAKTLARHSDSDMSLMMYPRPGLEAAALLLGLEDYLQPSDWTVPERPLEKLELLRCLAGKTARLTELANTRGLTLSPLNAVCLSHYLEMVQGILEGLEVGAS
ncbi:MAG: hypothetical protein JWN14_4025 [Chthonomonadales bacterium]|nr:hypothetical protein [Chthonomonadales bacterium]